MPNSPYTGLAFPPASQDNSMPLPGQPLVVQVPADDSAWNSATLFSGQYKQVADYATYVQESVRLRPPVVPASSSITGYTAVTHVGAGTGTVTPSALGATNGNVSVVIKVTAGGATGAATFKWSNDGGATFDGGHTTAGSYTDSTSGITVAFAGTFTLNDTYAFLPADTPQAAWVDEAGNIRSLVDHIGFPMGRHSKFREDWQYIIGASQTASPVTNLPYWNTAVSGTGALYAGFSVASSAAPWNGVQISPGTTNAAKSLLSSCPIFHPSMTGTAFVMEWDAYISVVGANNITYYMGVDNSGDPTGGGESAIYFTKTSSSTTWQCTSSDGTPSTVDSGVTPVASTYNRFRIEYHGSAGLYGAALSRFFIDEVLVAVITAHQPTAALRPLFGGVCTGSGSGNMRVGPILAMANRFASLPSL